MGHSLINMGKLVEVVYINDELGLLNLHYEELKALADTFIFIETPVGLSGNTKFFLSETIAFREWSDSLQEKNNIKVLRLKSFHNKFSLIDVLQAIAPIINNIFEENDKMIFTDVRRIPNRSIINILSKFSTKLPQHLKFKEYWWSFYGESKEDLNSYSYFFPSAKNVNVDKVLESKLTGWFLRGFRHPDDVPLEFTLWDENRLEAEEIKSCISNKIDPNGNPLSWHKPSSDLLPLGVSQEQYEPFFNSYPNESKIDARFLSITSSRKFGTQLSIPGGIL